jgi:hypothetical protein
MKPTTTSVLFIKPYNSGLRSRLSTIFLTNSKGDILNFLAETKATLLERST